MPETKTRKPVVEGWFTVDEDPPALLGSRCTDCGTVSFPKETVFCRNPVCQSTRFAETRLSRTGTIWSYTDARYQPPAPYVAADPYTPFAIAAVALDNEQMVVMGQVVSGVGVEELHLGDEVELVVDTLFEDGEHEYLVWKWRPTGRSDGGTTRRPTGTER
ncbi:MAG: Zn-ribbon domain-containing OB-fold protein [Acidimicrobiales bacterium]